MPKYDDTKRKSVEDPKSDSFYASSLKGPPGIYTDLVI